MKNILLILLLMILFSCKPNDDLHRGIHIYNNADYKIWITYSLLYPDKIAGEHLYTDIPDHSMKIYNLRIPYENLIAENPENTIIFFVRKDITPIGSEVYELSEILKRYILTLDSLNILNWTIAYP